MMQTESATCYKTIKLKLETFARFYYSFQRQKVLLRFLELCQMDNSSNKRIAKNTLFLYFRMLLVMGVTLFTSRVVLSTLGETDFGLYNVVGGVVTSLTFISLAMANATSRYMTFALGKEEIEQQKKVFSTALWIHILLSIIIFIIAESIGLWFLNSKMSIPENRYLAANIVYQFSILATMFSIISSPFNSAIIAHERMGVFAYISIFDVLAKLGIAYLLYISPFDRLIIYGALFMTVQLIDMSFYMRYCKTHFDEVCIRKLCDFSLVKEIGAFAGWSLIGNLSFMCYTQGLNILLNMFFGPIVNAARGIAVQVQSAVMGFIQNFQTAVSPQITKSYANNDIERLQTLLHTSSRLSFFILFCMLLPIFLEADMILSLWLEKVPGHTSSFLRLILMVSILDCLTRPVTIAMNATGRIKRYQIISCGIQLLILPLAYAALKIGGIPEVVFVVHFFISIVALIAELKIFNDFLNTSIYDYFKSVIIPISKVVAISLVIPFLCHYYMSESFVSSIFVIVISLVSVLISSFFLGMTDNEKIMVIAKLKKVLKYEEKN